MAPDFAQASAMNGPLERRTAFLQGLLADQRAHRRVVIALGLRFMSMGGSEHAGHIVDMSVGGMSIACEPGTAPGVGARVIVYIEDIGRVEGSVVRLTDLGFAVQLDTTPAKRDRLAERLTWHANRNYAHLEDLRRHDRTDTEHRTRLFLADGRELDCRVIDLSLGGVSIAADPPPPVGARVVIGRMQGRVVRHHEKGAAIEFVDAPPSKGSLAERLLNL